MEFSLSDLSKREVTVLLVDDQAIIGEVVRRHLAAENDITFHYCSDPTQALEVARKVRPTVILQDLVMPVMDGLTLVKQFRADEATQDVPIIVLSTKEEGQVKAESFALGANDYIVKLPDRVELIARIRYHSKGFIALLERNEAYDKLLASRQALAGELEKAAEYVKSLLPQTVEGPIQTDWLFIPSVTLGGDAFGYHWLDEERFAIYLLDVCGHGVGAALLSVSALNVLRTQTLPEVDFSDPGAVLGGLNNAFDMERHNQMYFTIWYGVFHKTTRELYYASGGHPPPVVVDRPGSEPRKIEVPGLIIGAIAGTQYETRSASIGTGARLYVFSDGVYEVQKADGSMMELEEFASELSAPVSGDDSKLEAMADFARRAGGQDTFEDDFSLLEVRFA